jgi:hypothetical protein
MKHDCKRASSSPTRPAAGTRRRTLALQINESPMWPGRCCGEQSRPSSVRGSRCAPEPCRRARETKHAAGGTDGDAMATERAVVEEEEEERRWSGGERVCPGATDEWCQPCSALARAFVGWTVRSAARGGSAPAAGADWAVAVSMRDSAAGPGCQPQEQLWPPFQRLRVRRATAKASARDEIGGVA